MKIFIVTLRTEDTEHHALAFNQKPMKSEIREAFEDGCNNFYDYDEDTYDERVTETEIIEL